MARLRLPLLAAGLILAAAAPPPDAASLAAASANAKLRADTAQAVILAERQVAAAIALRKLEDNTDAAAVRLAALQAAAAKAQAALAAAQTQLASLLPVMQRLAARPAATLLAAPGNRADAIRGALILQGIAAEIAQDAAGVAADRKTVLALLRDMAAEQTRLTAAVARQEAAEAALSAQIAAAKAVEMADSNAAIRAAAALAAKQPAGGVQGAIARLTAARTSPGLQPNNPQAAGGAPVAGAVVQNFGDDTLAGPAEGVSYQAPPAARVAAPCAGAVLFADHFPGYGLLVILDCGAGYDFVLSGMARLDVSAGQELAHGQPLGDMPAFDPKHPTRLPVLYVELRRNGVAVDPGAWLGAGGSG